MRFIFTIHYHTFFGQQLYICGDNEFIGNWDTGKAIPLNYSGEGNWEKEVEMELNQAQLNYKYFIKDATGKITWEWGKNHFIRSGIRDLELIRAADSWQNPPPEERALYTSSFTNVIMKPGANKQRLRPTRAAQVLEFRLDVPRVGQDFKVCILGNHSLMGNWDPRKPLVMECDDEFPGWTARLNLTALSFPLEYKYGIWDIHKKETVSIEEGLNRELHSPGPLPGRTLYIKQDVLYRHKSGPWKGAGVSVPVFSLHSGGSFGVGDFTDLVRFIDWARHIGLKMVQVLPVNETIAMHNWLDSYPYKAISVMALHPLYLRVEKMGSLDNPDLEAEFEKERKKLNKKSIVDYPEVLKVKSRYYKLLFDKHGEKLFRTQEFKTFFRQNEDWLVQYAAFVYLRDKMKSPDFREWGEYSVYDEKRIRKLVSHDSPAWEDIAVHYYLQFHLHTQLKEAADYARSLGIILKGDIPIGVSPNSVEAWTEPSLFNLDAQAGAPPDDFAVKGQNWGFPTYNWDAMAKNGYRWWIRRMEKMAEYFDTYRIDHILGFFRIWEVPGHAVEALLGYFNPALPMSEDEIRGFGIDFHTERFARPYIRHHLLHSLFGSETDNVISEFLENKGNGVYDFKKAFNTQKKVNAYFLEGIEEEDLDDHRRRIRNGLFDLLANVLFVKTGEHQWHPRISIQQTSSFQELDPYSRDRLQEVYNHYFYHRHNDFWYQKGMEKLPQIISVGNMLVCGEDLGMIPDCVPWAMKELGILSLEIQRMPKDPRRRFAHPADSPYLAVCTTSTHDMSTIRGWWEEDRDRTMYFFNHELGNEGEAPYFAEPWICRQIIVQHLHSPAMWVTLPIQDLLSIDGELRWDETQKEQINHPANVRHRWHFKMKQSIEDLEQADKFNEQLKILVMESGRAEG